jgi:hypothetical protein
VYGWDAASAGVEVKNGPDGPAAAVDKERHMLAVDLPDDGQGSDVEIRKSN